MSRRVVLVDAVRTPFGKAGSMYAGTRADDLMVRAIRGLLERNPKLDPKAIDDVAGDYDFTLAVIRDLVKAMENEDPEHAGKFKAIAEILDQIQPE